VEASNARSWVRTASASAAKRAQRIGDVLKRREYGQPVLGAGEVHARSRRRSR